MTARTRSPAFALPVSADDVARHALAAYYRAVAEATAPQGEPNAAGWSSPDDFVVSLLDFFQLRLRAEAVRAGFSIEADLERYDRWLHSPASRDQHIRDVDPGRWAELCSADPTPLVSGPSGAGRSPAQKGHGCPAPAPGALSPASAVGPAATASRGAYIIDPGNPFFVASGMQELPSGDTPVDTPEMGGTYHAR